MIKFQMYVMRIKSVFLERTKPRKPLKLQELRGFCSKVRYFLLTIALFRPLAHQLLIIIYIHIIIVYTIVAYNKIMIS